MPVFHNPRKVTVETGDWPGPLVVLALVVVLIGSGVAWLLGELEKIQPEVWAATGAVVVTSLAATVWDLRREYRRNTLIYYDPEAARQVAAEKRAGRPQVTVNVTVNAPSARPAPEPARPIENHYHQHLHLHGLGREVRAAVAAAMTRKPSAVTDSAPAAIEPRNVMPGVVLSDRRPAIEETK
jgi:Flp pilus assembly protein TadB